MLEFTSMAEQLIRYVVFEEAKRLNQNEVHPEHLFLAILREGMGISIKMLKALQFDFTEARKTIEKELLNNKEIPLLKDGPFFSLTMEALFITANREAQSMGYSYIGTEHLLLALYLTKDNIALLFNELGIDGARLRQEIVAMITSQADQNVHSLKFINNPSNANDFAKEKKGSFYKTPLLDSYSQDLTVMVKTGKLDPVIGREKEIERIIQILSRRHKNNAIIIGEPGVGKTALVEGLAFRIESGDLPFNLLKKRLLIIDLLGIIAGTKYRGEFEDRLRKIIKEVKKAQNLILFIDEIHTIVGAGAAEGAMDAANILKPELARGEIQVIGATTLSEYKKYIEKDAALERRFQPILVQEPNEEETLEILEGLQEKYASFHRVQYTKESLLAAIQLSQRYINDRRLPDKAIDILDEVGARMSLSFSQKPDEILSIQEKIQKVQNRKEKAVQNENFEKASQFRDELRKLEEHLLEQEKEWKENLYNRNVKITENDVAKTISFITGIPFSRISKSEAKRFLELENYLSKKIIGQNKAIESLAKAIRRVKAGIHSRLRPLGSFLFLGPTGVGKTQLAKELAGFLFDKKDSLKRFDMSDFMEKHTISRLTGAPPGYVGFEEGGILTEYVRKNPYSLILFDEIEKAHPDVFNILLQVFEEGELSDNLGHKVNFSNTIIILTSNLGTGFFDDKNPLGFSSMNEDLNMIDKQNQEYQKESLKKVKEFFRPEFINRLDSIVPFHKLSKVDISEIIAIMLNELKDKMLENKITLEITNSVKTYLLEKGFDDKYGARSLRRTISEFFEDPLSSFLLLKGRVKNIKAEVIDNKLLFSTKK
jgi:ATP-dependent Clp protease ATP-binding subunit ClpC